MIRAAIYARVSSQIQRERHTIENQLRVLRAFIAAQGWTLAGTFVDDGRSAKAGKLDEREGFAELLIAAEARAFDLLVVVDVDRLTRTDSIEERAQILGPFQRLGIDIVTPSGGRLDMRTMLGELWVTIQALGAAEENRKRAERIKAGKLRAIAEGRKPAGPTPYGLTYSRELGAWSVHPEAGPIVVEIFERVIDGEACRVIAEDFARRGVGPAPRKGAWTQAAIYRIVRNRASCGEFSADKRRGAVIKVPPVVSEKTWQEAQRSLMLHRRRGLRKTRHVYLLEGLARCACGGRIDIRSACGEPGKKNKAAYVCRNRRLKKGCTEVITKCGEMDERVWAAVCDELEQPDLLEAIAEVGRERAADVRDWRADVEGYRDRLARLEKIEAEAMARYRRGQISQGALDIELEAIAQDRVAYRNQLAAAERAIGASASASARTEAAASLLARWRLALRESTPEQRRAFLRELAHGGGVVIERSQARLDLRLPRSAAATSRGVSSVALVESTGYRTLSEPTLRIRRVA